MSKFNVTFTQPFNGAVWIEADGYAVGADGYLRFTTPGLGMVAAFAHGHWVGVIDERCLVKVRAPEKPDAVPAMMRGGGVGSVA